MLSALTMRAHLVAGWLGVEVAGRDLLTLPIKSYFVLKHSLLLNW